MKNILFVCTGNSCRSLMAEGLGNDMADNRFDCKSAGVAPIGVHPMSIKTMAEIGIDISEYESKMLTPALIDWADYVINLCNSARDNCPVIPGDVKKLHWDIENPDRLYLSESARDREFARVRDEIKRHIEKLYNEID